jgi:hypothetical protein
MGCSGHSGPLGIDICMAQSGSGQGALAQNFFTRNLNTDVKRITQVVTQWPQPKSIYDILIFLGFVNFYRRFIKGYLYKLLKMSGKKRENYRAVMVNS